MSYFFKLHEYLRRKRIDFEAFLELWPQTHISCRCSLILVLIASYGFERQISQCNTVCCILYKTDLGILTFCWPCCISVYLSQYLTNLMHKICFTISFISCLYMFRAHVLIIRRSKLYYTASGIIKPIGLMILWNKFCASSWLNTGIKNLRSWY